MADNEEPWGLREKAGEASWRRELCIALKMGEAGGKTLQLNEHQAKAQRKARGGACTCCD